MSFECLQEKYEDDLEPYDAEDIITLEKGEQKFEQMQKNRLAASEDAKLKKQMSFDQQKAMQRS